MVDGKASPSVQGFTLLEALIAMVLSSVVVMLVTSVFVVQNRFYSQVVNRASLHESVRTSAALVSSDLRGLASGGVVAAEPDSLVIRAPLAMGVVCGVDQREAYVFLPLGGSAFRADEVSGYGLRDPAGSWSYTSADWSSVHRASGSGPAGVCAGVGAEVEGASEDFHRLDDLAGSGALKVGDMVMVFQERVLKIGVSALDPSSKAIYRGRPGGTLAEVATGLSEESGFWYGTPAEQGLRRWVRGRGNLEGVNKIQFVAAGAAPSGRLGVSPSTFQLTVTVPPKNVR
jgi:prepilin-type N-terminal cleavage/methylation domain-containing protein